MRLLPAADEGGQDLLEVLIFPLHLSLIFQLFLLDEGLVDAQSITTSASWNNQRELIKVNIYWY